MRTIAIGDIHGCSTALDALLAVVKPTADDRLVFLGDYVDRGPDTKGVLDRVIGLTRTHPHTVCLRGNHEIMMHAARVDRDSKINWLSVGGEQALLSYSATGRPPVTLADVPEEHWTFLASGLRDWFETDTHIFVHANLYPELDLGDQPEMMLFWEFLIGPIGHLSGKTVVVGHSTQPGGLPRDFGDTLAIDTGAYKRDGWLTALDVRGLGFWQANQRGETRRGDL